MALLEHELAQTRFQYNLVLAAILEATERERQKPTEEKDADISDCSPSVPLAPPSSPCIHFRGDFLVFTASVFWPFPLLLAGCCLFLPQSPSLSLTNVGILFIKSVKSESCGYNLLNAVYR